MRLLSGTVLGLGLFAAACSAPVDTIPGQAKKSGSATAAPAPAPAADPNADTFEVGGHVSAAGNGDTALGLGGPNLPAAATSVDVMAMGEDGTLTTVATAPVVDGTFSADVPAGSSPTQIYIIKAKDAVNSVVGSAVINGVPAFFKAFFVDAPIDTETSFKAEILQTIAKKGVPGVQNYLNVVNTFVNDWVTDSLTVMSAFAEDGVNIVTSTSDAIIAGENVLESTLASAGIPLDLGALQKAQVAVVSGFDGTVMSSEGKIMSADESFFQSLEAAEAKAVAPIDKAIFNAVVNASGAIGHSLKQSNGNAHDLQLASTKSTFSLQTALSTRNVKHLFGQNDSAVTGAVQTAADQFATAVRGAKSIDDLTTAQTAFTNSLLSKNTPSGQGVLSCLVSNVNAICNAIESTIAPCVSKLTGAYTTATSGASYDAKAFGDALAAFDASSSTAPKQMNGMSAGDANALMEAVGFVQKQVAP